MKSAGRRSDSFLFPSRARSSPHLGTRQYARIVDGWVDALGLDSAAYGIHSVRRLRIVDLPMICPGRLGLRSSLRLPRSSPARNCPDICITALRQSGLSRVRLSQFRERTRRCSRPAHQRPTCARGLSREVTAAMHAYMNDDGLTFPIEGQIAVSSAIVKVQACVHQGCEISQDWEDVTPNPQFERTRGSVLCCSFIAAPCYRLRERAAQSER